MTNELFDKIGEFLSENDEINHEWPCDYCGTYLINIADFPEVKMQCPSCSWTPIKIMALN